VSRDNGRPICVIKRHMGGGDGRRPGPGGEERGESNQGPGFREVGAMGEGTRWSGRKGAHRVEGGERGMLHKENNTMPKAFCRKQGMGKWECGP